MNEKTNEISDLFDEMKSKLERYKIEAQIEVLNEIPTELFNKYSFFREKVEELEDKL